MIEEKKRICKQCEINKDINDFRIKDDLTGRRNKTCKKCLYLNRKEKVNGYNKLYRDTHIVTDDEKKKRKEYMKKWWKSENGKLTAKVYRQKRRERELYEGYSKEDRLETFKLFNNKCFNCPKIINLTIDHHKPFSKNNALSKTNAVVLCQSCNSRKHNKDPKDFYSKVQIIILEESYNIIS